MHFKKNLGCQITWYLELGSVKNVLKCHKLKMQLKVQRGIKEVFAPTGQIRNVCFKFLKTGMLSICAVKTRGQSPGPALVLCGETIQINEVVNVAMRNVKHDALFSFSPYRLSWFSDIYQAIRSSVVLTLQGCLNKGDLMWIATLWAQRDPVRNFFYTFQLTQSWQQ